MPRGVRKIVSNENISSPPETPELPTAQITMGQDYFGGTEASRLMRDRGGQPINEGALAGTGVFEAPKVKDEFDLTPGDKARFGYNEGWAVKWVRDSDSEMWKTADPGQIQQSLERYPGSKLLRDAKGNLCRPTGLAHCDLVALQVPPEVEAYREARHLAQTRQFLSEVSDDQPGGSHPYQWDKSEERIEEEKDNTRTMMQGIRQSLAGRFYQSGLQMDTEGIPLHKAWEMISDKERESEAARLRNGPKHHEATKEDMVGMLTGRSIASEKKTYGVGKGLGNKNPNSALAQSQRRNAGQR